MMLPMPKIAAPRAYLDGLDPDDPATGRHYADMLEERDLREGAGNRARLHRRAGRRRLDRRAGAAGGLHAADPGEICDQYGVLLIHDEVIPAAAAPASSSPGTTGTSPPTS